MGLSNTQVQIALELTNSMVIKWVWLSHFLRENMVNVISLSIVLGLAQGMIYYLFAAGIRLGSFLVVRNYIQYDDVFR